MMASLVPNVSGMSPSMPQSQLLSYQMAQIQMLQQMAYMQKLAQEHSQNSRPEESPQSPLDLSSQFSMFKPQESNHHQAEEILKTFPHLAHLGYGGLPGLSGRYNKPTYVPTLSFFVFLETCRESGSGLKSYFSFLQDSPLHGPIKLQSPKHLAHPVHQEVRLDPMPS